MSFKMKKFIIPILILSLFGLALAEVPDSKLNLAEGSMYRDLKKSCRKFATNGSTTVEISMSGSNNKILVYIPVVNPPKERALWMRGLRVLFETKELFSDTFGKYFFLQVSVEEGQLKMGGRIITLAEISKLSKGSPCFAVEIRENEIMKNTFKVLVDLAKLSDNRMVYFDKDSDTQSK